VLILGGTGLNQTTQVTVGGALVLTFLNLNDGSLLAVVPSDAVSGSVVVTTATSTATLAGFTLETALPTPTPAPTSFHTPTPIPTITPTPTPTPAPFAFTSFTPTSQYAGDSVILNGSGFSSLHSVTVGGVNAPSFTAISDTVALLIIPSNAVSG
jgi:hypothetical protein